MDSLPVGSLWISAYGPRLNTVDCSNTEGVNPVEATCLYKELLLADSVMAATYDSLLARLWSDSQRAVFRDLQGRWLILRRDTAGAACSGLRGHVRAIYFFAVALESTRLRTRELETLIDLY
jgi:uncharacterized protein YecT (DUF1311 family)